MPPHVITKATALANPDRVCFSEIVPFLPACYNLPIKKIQSIFNTSHATLARAKEAWGLSNWPFDSITKGRFIMTWDEVDQLQQAMLQGASEKMARFLREISQKSREYKNRPKKIRASKARAAKPAKPAVKPAVKVSASTSESQAEASKSPATDTSPSDTSSIEGCREEETTVLMESSKLTSTPAGSEDSQEDEIEVDLLLLHKLQEDTSVPPSPQDVEEMSDFQRFYELLDPAREPVEPASPSLLEDYDFLY